MFHKVSIPIQTLSLLTIAFSFLWWIAQIGVTQRQYIGCKIDELRILGERTEYICEKLKTKDAYYPHQLTMLKNINSIRNSVLIEVISYINSHSSSVKMSRDLKENMKRYFMVFDRMMRDSDMYGDESVCDIFIGDPAWLKSFSHQLGQSLK